MWYHVAHPYMVQHYNTDPGLLPLPSYIMFINTQEAKINTYVTGVRTKQGPGVHGPRAGRNTGHRSLLYQYRKYPKHRKS